MIYYEVSNDSLLVSNDSEIITNIITNTGLSKYLDDLANTSELSSDDGLYIWLGIPSR